ncbi:Preprotein translocase subunit YajC (TC 3.A.5.1.1) [Rhodovastum atsumiense]|uniref:Sec translocon accessory complex subunit YajC n=1 Tax=Rhodovastum atsumiense TaxID=504468 RepID=A0A5M6IN36_9PROT|nr:preprotein translocase subunit YajC [Rhodovastum atsumiense]CAH2604588.1 Preprotein translocase subunit YajC (TC 3.A.5.1.1) [Rhodovastum atsumiense]
MLISPAYAQDAAGAGAAGAFMQFLPLILIFAVFYFLLIRPQQQKQKQMRLALAALKRGDRVITGGGVLGTVSKAPKNEDREIELEIAPNVRIAVLRETISAVITPQPANDSKPAAKPARAAGEAAKPLPDIKAVKEWLDKKGWFNKKKV